MNDHRPSFADRVHTRDANESRLPLCVDLDGTLIYTDLLLECLIRTIYRRPWAMFLVPAWLMKGKQFLKEMLARYGSPDVSVLPYVDETIELVRAARDSGRHTVLISGSYHSLVVKVSEHIGLFDVTYATDGLMNLTGRRKAEFLVQLFGKDNYEYVANSKADLPVWCASAKAITVNAPKSVVRSARSLGKKHEDVGKRSIPIRSWLRAVRVQQWAKNLLLFVPLITSHQVFRLDSLLAAGIAFVCFSFCASSVYIFNDLGDLDADRHHLRKRFRPLAAGVIEIVPAAVLGLTMLGLGIAGSMLLSVEFQLTLLTYVLTTALYSLVLKRIASLDVILLAALYTLRIIAGAYAIEVVLSFWLLAFSLFLFLCLALVKRVAELIELQETLYGEQGVSLKAKGRQYGTSDIETLKTLGASSGYLSVLVLALYLNSPEVVVLYQSPQLLWLIVPLELLWITRLWMVTSRGYMHDDPIVFAIRDPETWLTVAASSAIIFVASVVQLDSFLTISQ